MEPSKINTIANNHPKYVDKMNVSTKTFYKMQEARQQEEALRPLEALKEIFLMRPENVSQRAEKAWSDNIDALEDFDTLITTRKLQLDDHCKIVHMKKF